MSGVEFVEEPVPSGPDDPPRRPRLWWLVAAVLIVAAASAWALTRPSQPPQPPRPLALPSDHPVGTAPPSDPRAPSCHGAPFCMASLDIPTGVRAAVLHYLPATATLSVQSYIGRSLSTGSRYLSDRDIEARAGSVSVLISLRRELGAVPTAAPIVVAGDGFGSIVVHHDTGVYFVVLQYLAPETVPPVLSGLRMLARDIRLEAL